jgi:MFS family permease
MMIIFGLGASLGGPVAGWLSDNYSWAWAFYAQVSPMIHLILLEILMMQVHPDPVLGVLSYYHSPLLAHSTIRNRTAHPTKSSKRI